MNIQELLWEELMLMKTNRSLGVKQKQNQYLCILVLKIFEKSQ